jgi:hypothetical protein
VVLLKIEHGFVNQTIDDAQVRGILAITPARDSSVVNAGVSRLGR